MITPNGGVFGRNPKFNTVTTQGGVTSTGGLTVTPNTTAPTSNVTIGPSAGAGLLAAATGNICIGSGAGDVLGASGRNVAIGTNALGAFSAGAATITNTTPGTGGTGAPTTYNNILLEKDSGTGTMTVYPTVNLRVSTGGAVDLITIVSPGSGATVASGIVLKAVTTPAGVPTNWRGTLASVTGDNVAIGNNALLLNSTSSVLGPSVAIGSGALDALTTGGAAIAIGQNALGSATTASEAIAIGENALRDATTSSELIAIGRGAGSTLASNETILIGHSTGPALGGSSANTVAVGSRVFAAGSASNCANSTAIGSRAFQTGTAVNGSVAVGSFAGAWRGTTGINALNQATNSIFIGYQSRGLDNGQTNQIVIAGFDQCGDGSNTTVVNNSSTTSTRIAGTATSVFRIDGDTMRITGTRTPASNAAGTAGDFCFGTDSGTTYLYYCVANGTWVRFAGTGGY